MRFISIHLFWFGCLVLHWLVGSMLAYAQIGIGTATPRPSAQLDVRATDKGFLLPRLTTANRTALGSILISENNALNDGMQVYDTDTKQIFYWNETTDTWVAVSTGSGSDVTTASNGLTEVGDDVRLGGTLTGPTTITQAGNHFSLTGGNVGIGTSTPNALLDVNGGTPGYFRVFDGGSNDIDFDGGTNGIFIFNNSSVLAGAGIRFKAGAQHLVTMQNTGNIGINNTAPAERLDLRDGNFLLSNSGTAGQLRFQEPNASGANFTAFQAQAQATDVTYTLPTDAPSINGQALTSTTAGVMSWSTLPTGESTTASNGLTLSGVNVELGGTLTGATTIAQAGHNFRLTGNGNVGIGQPSPGSKLSLFDQNATDDVLTIVDIWRGNSAGNGASGIGSAIAFRNEASNGSFGVTNRINAISEVTTIGADFSAFDFEIRNNGTLVSALYLNSTGAGFGTTSPSQKLHVQNGNVLVSNTNNTAGEIRLAEPSGSGTQFTAFRAGIQSADITYTLPTTNTNGVLTNTGGILSWAASGGVTGTGTADYLARWTSTTDIGIGVVRDNGQTVGINTAPVGFNQLRVAPTGAAVTTAIQAIANPNVVSGTTTGLAVNSTNSNAGVASQGATIVATQNSAGADVNGLNISVQHTSTAGNTSGTTIVATSAAAQGAVGMNTAVTLAAANTSGIAGRSQVSGTMNASGTSVGYDITNQATNGTEAFGLRSNVTASATSNYGLYSFVSGAVNNYPGVFMGGNVGIGTANPNAKLELHDGNLLLSNSGTAGQLRLAEPSGSGTNYTAFRAGAQTADITYTLPLTSTSGVLTNDGAGNLSWGAGSGWNLTGNSGTTDGTNFVGTTDNVPLNFKANNQKAGRIETAPNGNSFFGYQAGNSSGNALRNSAFGFNALVSTTGGTGNTALGYAALQTNGIGDWNTAVGTYSLLNNNGGGSNTGLGYASLQNNSSGSNNVAVGTNSLRDNTNGYSNTAIGSTAMFYNQSGFGNVALGLQALLFNVSGNQNTALGTDALRAQTGSQGVGVGSGALYFATGNGNTAVGFQAGDFVTTGTNNTFVGNNADATVNNLTNATAIGYNASVSASNALVLGNNANVGIGVSSPSAKLDVRDGNVLLSNTGTAGEIRLAEPSGSGTNYTAFRAQPQAADITYTLPAVSSAGVLTNSGGTLLWDDGSGSFIQNQNTTDQAANFRINGDGALLGNIGIGTSDPSPALITLGQNSTPYILVERNTTGFGTDLLVEAGGGLLNGVDQNGGKLALSGGLSTGTGQSRITFRTYQVSGSGFTDNVAVDRMVIEENGYVGIGTATPVAPLHVNGPVKIGTSGMTAVAIGGGGFRYNGVNMQFSDGANWNNLLSGSGTANYVPRYTGSGSALQQGIIRDNGSTVGVNTAPVASQQLAVNTTLQTGIYGATSNTATNTTGVLGEITSTTGRTYGVRGLNASSTAFAAGMYGENTATSATEVYGVHGVGSGNVEYASGVMGEYRGAGVGKGVSGYSGSAVAFSSGVYGVNDATSGQVYGVYGRLNTANNNANAAGVYGVGSNVSTGGLAILGVAGGINGNSARFETLSTSPANFIIDARANGTSVLRVRSDGRVGIGTAAAAPNYPLDVTGVINAGTGYRVNNAAATVGTYLRGDGVNFVASTIQAADLPTGGTQYIQNQNAADQTADFRISGNGVVQGNIGVGLGALVPDQGVVVGKNAGYAEIHARSASTTVPLGNHGAFVASRSRGTLASPLAVVSGDKLGSLEFRGHNGTTHEVNSPSIASFAKENFTATNRGAELNFLTVPLGSGGTAQTRMVIDPGGLVGIGTFNPFCILEARAASPPASNEAVFRFGVQDAANDHVTLWNGIGTNGLFQPVIESNVATHQFNTLTLRSQVTAANDAGANPMMAFDVRRSTPAAIAVRPLFSWSNNGTDQMSMDATGNLRFIDRDFYFRGAGDFNHGLGYYGFAKLWNGTAVDGPVLYGYDGGVLGTRDFVSSIQQTVVRWNRLGYVSIGGQQPEATLHIRGQAIAGPGTLNGANGSPTFSVSTSRFFYRGEYYRPNVTTAQARTVTANGSGLTVNIAPNLSAVVGAQAYTVYPALLSIDDHAGASRLFVQGFTGNIGVGTITPTYPIDVQAGVVGPNLAAGAPTRYFEVIGPNNATGANTALIGANISIRSSGFMFSALGFVASSDTRIKTSLGQSNTEQDLAILNRLQITDYRLKDTLADKGRIVKGVLAQEVEAVYPQAVTRTTHYIPSVYRKALAFEFDSSQHLLTVTLDTLTDLQVGDQVKLITPQSEHVPAWVTEVKGKIIRFGGINKRPENVFVFGKEVHDFRVVDYDRLTALSISAIQELAKREAALQTENRALKARVETLESRFHEFQKSVEARLNALENTSVTTPATHTTAQVKR